MILIEFLQIKYFREDNFSLQVQQHAPWVLLSQGLFLSLSTLSLSGTKCNLYYVNLKMGGGSVSKETNQIEITTIQKNVEYHKAKTQVTKDSVDVIEVSNIALAIQNGDQHVINVQLTIGIKNLPAPKAFEELKTMIVLFKGCPQLLQIDRTQIISNDINPKFLTTFLLPSVSGNPEKIDIHIYNVIDSETDDLQPQKLIGTAQLNLQNLIDNDSNELEVNLIKASTKDRTFIHISCCEYDGGGMQYEVMLKASGFTGKLQLYYVIEVQKDNDWFPVAKSNTIEIKKTEQFQEVKVSAYKFPSQQTSRIRLRCYDVSKHEEELGFTDDIILGQLLNIEEGGISKRIQNNGFFMGNLVVHQWKRKQRYSFLTYIVNGARLHLILGIDYTNSTFKGSQNLHHPDDAKNLYVQAIKQIVGILQYFDYYNQIALYGFGAKLPPHYKSVGQCFALNGNYFQPLIVGGVEKIIKKYRQNLEKIKPHGPSKLSQIINMAIQFAQSAEGQSTNYYVLIILTDGTIDDFDETVEKAIQASTLPLSIVLVGLGDGDFTQLKKLDQDVEPLYSQVTKKTSVRDMIDFINFKQYLIEDRTPLTQIHLARKTFAEIPAQYVTYMQGKRQGFMKQKKGYKTVKNQFITQKINSGKKKENQPIIPEIQFLKEQKKNFKKKLLALGIEDNQTFTQTLKISMNDLNYFLEIYSTKLPPPVKEVRPLEENISFRQQKKFEERLQKNQKFANHRIQAQILKKEANQTGKRQRVIQKKGNEIQQKPPQLNHPCLSCKSRQICIVYGECGHLAICEHCQKTTWKNICIVCKQFNQYVMNINDYDL